MKIVILSMNNIYLIPYITKYLANLTVQVDIVYWDRQGIVEKKDNVNLMPLRLPTPDNSSRLKKLIGYLKFRKFAIKTIKNGDYNGVILLQSIIGVLLYHFLLKKYKKRYIFDIRDYTLEKNKIYYTIEKRIINNSYFTVISSQGFKKFLPKYNYTLTHNITFVEGLKGPRKIDKNDKIIISYIGLIRFIDVCEKFIDIFKNDDRFILKFIGEGSQRLAHYCDIKRIYNVILVDRFQPEDTINLYNDASIIYNLYGNSSSLVKHALSNKLYYAAQLIKPIAVQPDTFMAVISKKFDFGIEFDLEDNDLPDKIYNRYQAIDFKKMKNGCARFLKTIIEDENKYYQKIKNFQKNLEDGGGL